MLTLTVADVIAAGPRAHIVRLSLADHVFPYLAGQAVFVASHGDDLRKAFSLASAPEDANRQRDLEILVGASSAGGRPLWLNIGARVDVGGPIGRFTLPASCRTSRLVFIAGGTGIAPIRSMLSEAIARTEYRPTVVYSVRTPEEFAYSNHLHSMALDGHIDLRQTITRGDACTTWTGQRGRIDRSMLQMLVEPSHTRWFICGPPRFVLEIAESLRALSVSDDCIHVEDWLRGKRTGDLQ